MKEPLFCPRILLCMKFHFVPFMSISFLTGPAILHNIFCLYSLYYLFHLLKINGNLQGTVIRISM